MEHAVTQVVPVEADDGVAAAVEAGTHVAVAIRLVLVARAVVGTVTTHVDRQTVAVCHTPKVGLGTGVVVQRRDVEIP